MNNIDLIKNQVCEVEIGYKNKVKVKDRIKITDPSKAAEVVRALYDEDVIDYNEQFHVIGLNNGHQILCHKIIATGTTNACVVSIKAILQTLILTNSTHFIVSHNHPSGSTVPSSTDIELTKKIREAGKLVDITMIDHIIITSESSYSFQNENMF